MNQNSVSILSLRPTKGIFSLEIYTHTSKVLCLLYEIWCFIILRTSIFAIHTVLFFLWRKNTALTNIYFLFIPQLRQWSCSQNVRVIYLLSAIYYSNVTKKSTKNTQKNKNQPPWRLLFFVFFLLKINRHNCNWKKTPHCTMDKLFLFWLLNLTVGRD